VGGGQDQLGDQKGQLFCMHSWTEDSHTGINRDVRRNRVLGLLSAMQKEDAKEVRRDLVQERAKAERSMVIWFISWGGGASEGEKQIQWV